MSTLFIYNAFHIEESGSEIDSVPKQRRATCTGPNSLLQAYRCSTHSSSEIFKFSHPHFLPRTHSPNGSLFYNNPHAVSYTINCFACSTILHTVTLGDNCVFSKGNSR